jgi:Kef-type K+ transport system membrane component KefB
LKERILLSYTIYEMSIFLQLAFLLAIILLSAKMAGYLSIRFGQPSVLGELLVGILLGPSIINLLNFSFIDHELIETVAKLGELGVLLLMFLAGLELHFNEMKKNLRVAALAGLMGVAWPVLLGWGVGSLFGLDESASIFLGLALGATSVSISAQTLIELKALRSRVGLSLLGAAVFDDILIILLLSVFLALQSGGGSRYDILLIIVRMILFLIISVMFGLWALPWIIRRFSKLPVSQGLLTISLVIMLAYGIASEYFGGMGQFLEKLGLRDDIPLIPSLEDFYEASEKLSRTIFATVKEETMIDKIVAATQRVMGDLNMPETGMLLVMPVLKAYGLYKTGRTK